MTVGTAANRYLPGFPWNRWMAAILGFPLPSAELTMGDYPGLRQANQDISPTIEKRGKG